MGSRPAIFVLRLVLMPILVSIAFGAEHPCHAGTIVERSDLGAVFDEYGASGAFVIEDAQTGQITAFNRERAERRYVPGSTFKILNTLIALETGAVKDEREIIPYGGKPQPFGSWEKDMTMREAIAVSSIPIYQEIARRVGLQAYARWLRQIKYGNGQTGSALETFWLDGPLSISAFEQVEFLALLAQEKLPFSSRSQSIVRDLLRLESSVDHTLYGKTGWVTSSAPQTGWWVGWVERHGRIYAFALNIDLISAQDARNRTALGKALLAKVGVI